MAYMEEGCKPGLAIVLHTVDGTVAAGDVYILDPNHPGDLASGIGYPMRNLRRSGNTVEGEVTAVDAQGPGGVSRFTLKVTLKEPLRGAGPAAGVSSSGTHGGLNQEWQFFRVDENGASGPREDKEGEEEDDDEDEDDEGES
jgi:hypothetical protein